MKAFAALSSMLAILVAADAAVAESWLTLEPADYPAEVGSTLEEVRNSCREAGQQVNDYPQAGVTIIDIDRDGSKDILLDAWRACEVPIKGGGACNTAGCDIKIFKQVAPKAWKLVFDETVGSDWFLSASQNGHFRLMAFSVSRKIDSRCPDPSGSTCDFLLHRKNKRWIWQRIK